MTSGRIKTNNGRILRTSTGKIATGDDCCCDDPCSDCEGYSQDDLVISGTTPECDTACQADGTLSHVSSLLYEDCFSAGDCRWVWEEAPSGGRWWLTIRYSSSTGKWGAQLRYGQSACHESTAMFESTDVSGISCNPTTHKLEGSFTIPGLYWRCLGCTASVSL